MSRGWVLGRSRDQGEAPRQLTAAAAAPSATARPTAARPPGASPWGIQARRGAQQRASVRLMATRRLNESAVGARTTSRTARETATIGCGDEAAAVARAVEPTAIPTTTARHQLTARRSTAWVPAARPAVRGRVWMLTADLTPGCRASGQREACGPRSEAEPPTRAPCRRSRSPGPVCGLWSTRRRQTRSWSGRARRRA